MTETATPAKPAGDAAPQPDPAEEPKPPGRIRRSFAWAARAIPRYPATAAIIAVCLIAGLIATFAGSEGRTDILDEVSYGLPPLQDGRVWTFVVGMFFIPALVLYIPVLILLGIFASTYERRVGHWQTALIVIGGQIAGAVIVALFLWPFDGSGWSWAVELGRETDTGISAGLFACLGALSAVMQPVWRRRVRIGVTAYLFAMILQSGLLWDLEHFAAWVIGMLVGPLLAGRRPAVAKVRLGRRSQRALVALVIAISAISSLLEAFWPGNGGPFWAGNQRYHSDGVTLALVVVDILYLVLADGLRRGRRFAWWAITVLMALTFISLWGVAASAERTAELVISGLLLVMLLATYTSFNVRTRRKSLRRAGRRLLVVVVILFVYTAVGFAVLKDDFDPVARPADMVGEFFSRLVFTTSGNIEPVSTAAKWFVNSIGAVWLIALIGVGITMLYSSRRVLPEPEEDVRLRQLLRSYDSSNIEWMLTWRGNQVWFDSTGTSAIGYRVVGSVALALADPVGPPDDRGRAMLEFDKFCFNHGWMPCMFAAGATTAELAPTVRWKAVEVAEDGIVWLDNLEFKGKAWQDIRTAINKAGKEDIRLEATQWAEAKPVLTDQIQAISHGWVSDKSLPEMGFTLGTLREADDPDVRMFVAVDDDSTVHGFTSWMPVGDGGEVKGWTLDLMRRRDGGFRQVMEFLIAESAMAFKVDGYKFVSLSAAPLAKAPAHMSADSDKEVLQRLLDFLGDALEPYYGFQSLHQFKTKFQPEFRPMYLIYPDESALAEVGLAIVRAYLPDAGPLDFARMGLDMFLPKHTAKA